MKFTDWLSIREAYPSPADLDQLADLGVDPDAMRFRKPSWLSSEKDPRMPDFKTRGGHISDIDYSGKAEIRVGVLNSVAMGMKQLLPDLSKREIWDIIRHSETMVVNGFNLNGLEFMSPSERVAEIKKRGLVVAQGLIDKIANRTERLKGKKSSLADYGVEDIDDDDEFFNRKY